MSDLPDQLMSIVHMDAGPGRIVITPPASGTFSGSGLLSTERAMCEPIDPSELQSIDDDPNEPLAIRILRTMTQLQEYAQQRMARDMATLLGQIAVTNELLLNEEQRRDEYVTAVGLGYSNYVRDYASGYIELLIGMWKFLKASSECVVEVKGLTVEALLGQTEGPKFDAAVTQMTGACGPLKDVLVALAEVHAFFETLRDHPLDVVAAALELVAEFSVAAVEKLVDGEITEILAKYVSDHKAIGEFHGILFGIVVAEMIIDELISMGASKVIRAVRWVKKVPVP
ncbi:hypothetical protein ACWGJ0_35965 [Streptomyces massasporeus]